MSEASFPRDSGKGVRHRADAGPDEAPTYTVALSDALLARGRAVLLDGSLPSIADALCMLGPPFGDGAGAIERLSKGWMKQPLANSYDARVALDDVSVDDEDLVRLRDVLARDLTIAPRELRAPIGNAILQLDVALTWTGAGGVRLAGLSASHSRRSPDAEEKLLAAAAALAYGATGANFQGFPAYGRWGSTSGLTKDSAVEGLVATTRAVLGAFAERRMIGHALATDISAQSASDHTAVVVRATADLLRAVPDRLSFVDSHTAGFATFASLMCPGRVAELASEATRREEQRRDYEAWVAHVMLTHADAFAIADGLIPLISGMTAGRRFSAPGMIEIIDELEMISLPDELEDPLAARLSDIVRAVRMRLNLYAAHQGDPTAAARIASWSAGFAVARVGRNTFWPMMVASLVWAERSSIGHPFALSPNASPRLPDVDDVMTEPVASRLDDVAAELAGALATVTVEREDGAESEERSFAGLWRRSVATPPETRRTMARSADAAAGGRSVAEEGAIVVVRSIAEGKTAAAREMQAEFKEMVGASVPLVFTRDVREAYRRLVAEAPYARAIIDVVLRDTAGSRTATWRPTILVGTPGSGKTRLCLRICQELHIPHRIFACGGVSNSSFNGTSRQWSTGRASIPLQLVRQHRVANPAIVLDEIDKVSEGRQNGNLIDGLLSMLEPLNSSSIFDVYLEGEVDLHRVLWLATANDAGALHPALLDRFRILEMPDPRAEDLLALLPGVTSAVVERRGLSPEWIAPFDVVELGIIADLWPGGSIRRLARVVEAILDARDNPQRAN